MWKRGRPGAKFAVRSLIVLALMVIRITKDYLAGGWGTVGWEVNLWLVLGWTGGYWLSDVDDLFYVYLCNPQELTCQRIRLEVQRKDWRNAWGLLAATRLERLRLPVHNVLTGLVVAVMGLWMVTSGGSVFASGVVLGLGVRLFIGILIDTNYKRWYWVFARDFAEHEHRVVVGIWGLLLALQAVFLLRG